MSEAVSVVQIRETGYELTKPADMLELASALRGHIKTQNLYTMIKGKAYPHVEAWQFAGACLGLLPIVESCDDISTDGNVRYRATVRIVDMQGTERGRGVAICSNTERLKTGFEEYAVASMAQTRAVGRAYRLCIGWVLKTAGYEATPAEEFDEYTMQSDVPLDQLTIPFGDEKGKLLSEMEYEDIAHAISWARAKTRKQFHAWAERANEYLVEYHETAGATK